jgi:hypothetical protein
MSIDIATEVVHRCTSGIEIDKHISSHITGYKLRVCADEWEVVVVRIDSLTRVVTWLARLWLRFWFWIRLLLSLSRSVVDHIISAQASRSNEQH